MNEDPTYLAVNVSSVIRSPISRIIRGVINIPVTSNWILATGVWRDEGEWIDDATWNDGE